LKNAVAYFNTDVCLSGPNFNAAAVPSLKQFVREVTTQVPSPKGGTVYDEWKKASEAEAGESGKKAGHKTSVSIDNLGSGSDYTPLFQHMGVPSTDVGSDDPYGVYHSTF